MSSNYGFEPTLDGLNNIDSDSTTTTNIICDNIQINVSGTAPTVSALSNDTNIATTAWVSNHTSGTYMTLATTQTATGEKTFSNANTFITGNTITNNIVSASPTSNINIGSALTTGDINLGNSGLATGVALNWGGASNSGNLSFQGGSFTLASTGVYTQRSGPTFDMTIADTQTSGILNLGTGVRTGAINLGTGVSSKNITMGNNTGGGTTLFNGTNVLMRAATFVGVGDSMGGGVINIGRNDAGATTTTTSINNGTAHTGAVNIASGCVGNAPITIGSTASTTQTATHNAITTFSKIPSCAVAPTTANHLCNKTYTDSVAGGAGLLTSNNTFSGTNAFTNTLNLNATGTATTNIGASGTATNINGTISLTGKPFDINYTTSSHSETTAAIVLTQLNGTFRSTVTWTAWTTGTFNYVMNQFIPGVPGWTWPGGFITLAAGSYSFNFAFSFDDATAYNLTDLRVGISTSSILTAASSDAIIIASLPGGNLTCYKHYVTTITPAGSDIIVEQMSGSFYLSASTAIYPFARINNSAAGGINTVIFDLTLTRIGL